MLARLSDLFARTMRDDPTDAEVVSHRLLVRAGYVRRVTAGVWTWLPLGLRVLERVAAIVREEMVAIGGQEVLLPALLPREPYEVTGRWTEYGEGVFRLKDRRGLDYLLGPTHEELFTLLVKSECTSYRQLPLILFQIQTKYRDEARPRAGILRAREFLMKDSYSFDLDSEGLRRSYDLHRGAYVRIFDRLGLDYRIVAATSGAMGGSASEEFLAVAESGEDRFAACSSCGYAANVEAVAVPVPASAGRPVEEAAPLEVLETPGTPTIETLVGLLGVGPEETLKNVVVRLRYPGGGTEVLVVGVPGDREVDERRLAAVVEPALVEPFTAADFAATGLVRGYLGPQVLAELGIRYLVDPRVAPGTSWVTGANEEGRHASGVTRGRDFEADLVAGVADVRDGDPCPVCVGELRLDRAIEVGHVFQLGRKYTDAFGVDVLGPGGVPQRVTMGSYGIGVSRVVAAVVEQHADDLGLRWPPAVAPFDVHVCALGKEGQLEAASSLAAAMSERGLDVLLDDRRLSPGVQLKDAELLGVPVTVVVGRGLAAGEVEVRDRWRGERRTVPQAEVAEVIEELAGDV